MQKIVPCLWFDTHCDEAMTVMTSSFSHAKTISIKRYPDTPSGIPMQGMEGKVLTAIFELAGQRFMALDGGPLFKFTPAISFFVHCASEAEFDQRWSAFSDGGMVLMPVQQYPFSEKFGWLVDKYGLSWQLNLGARQQQITPFLTFVGAQHGKAEEAMRFYTSLFANAGIESIERYSAAEDGVAGKAGTVKHALFKLDGQEFMAIDSHYDHNFTFNEAISFYVECDTQAEIDHFWYQMSAVPEAEQCGWLKDKFGVSWQIVPTILGDLMSDPDQDKSTRVMNAMLKMKKFDIDGLKRAYVG